MTLLILSQYVTELGNTVGTCNTGNTVIIHVHVHAGSSGIIGNSGNVREMSKFTQSINDFSCPFIVYIMD